MENEERMWELISVKLTGEITADELAVLASMSTGDPVIENLLKSLESLWHSSAGPSAEDIAKKKIQ